MDCIVSDVKMPGMGGVELLKEVLADWPEVKVILLTAHGHPDAAWPSSAPARPTT